MLKPLQTLEKRQFGRRQTGCHGWVRVRGRPPLACQVKNISDGGALLEFPAAETLPYRFRLIVESEGIDRECETRHQTGTRMGVEFIKSAPPVETGPKMTANDVSAWTSKRR